MKILFVHNDYAKYSGEEAVVDKMSKLFYDKGYEVAFYRMSTEGVRESLCGKIRGFINGIYSPSGTRRMREILEREHPDVVNVHNLFPFIGPAALFECKKRGIPVIMTIHNFRLICPTGLFMRNEKPCEYCLNHGNEWGCIKYNCEHSFLKSLGYAARNATARWIGAYKKCVTRFICITEFQRKKLIAAGFDANKISVIPNSMDVPASLCSSNVGQYVAFSGRISTEKGVDLIIEVARRHPEIPFKLAGAIRDKYLVENCPNNVDLMGYLSGERFVDFYKNSRFVVMASKCYEGFPMAILEAAKYGKTVIAPNHGGFTEIIGNNADAIGKLFKPTDVNDLERQILTLWNNPKVCSCLGIKAFEKLEKKYSTNVIFQEWVRVMLSIKEAK